MRAERVARRGIAIAAGIVVVAVLAAAGILIATQSNAASGQSATSSTSGTPTASVPTPSKTPSTTPPTTSRPTTEKPTSKPTRVLPKALWNLDDTGLDVRKLEARLVQLGLLNKKWVDGSYGTMTRSAVRSFQTQHGMQNLGYVDQATWDKLVALTREPTHDELYPPKAKPDDPTSAKLDPRCVTGRALCIDKTSRKLRWVVDGQVLLTTDVRFGSVRTPTRMGAFQVGWKSRFHHSKLYDSDMPYAMFFSGGQAVHYSSDFAARGYAGASHGCVNVRNLTKIKWLFDQVQVGDKVIVYRS